MSQPEKSTALPDHSTLTIWVDRHGRPCDSMRHDAQKLEVVPAAERDRLERELAEAVAHLADLADWGWGENAPDQAVQSWMEARRWLAKHDPHASEQTGRTSEGGDDACDARR